MLNRIEYKKDALTIQTFPTRLALICLVVLCATLYAAIFKALKPADIAIPVFVIGVFSVLLERKTTHIDKHQSKITIESARLFKKSKQDLHFSDINNVGIRTGKGEHAHSGVVTLYLADDEVSVTTMASLNHKNQKKVVSYIKDIMGYPPNWGTHNTCL